MSKRLSVTERIEHVRQDKGLNKSTFSSTLGMKPQTYNNFTGKQASKPNLNLLMGIVTRYGVNPTWLLTGTGPVYADGVIDGGALIGRSGLGSLVAAAEVSTGKARKGGNNPTLERVNADRSRTLRPNKEQIRRQLTLLQAEMFTLTESCVRISSRLADLLDLLDSTLSGEHEKQTEIGGAKRSPRRTNRSRS